MQKEYNVKRVNITPSNYNTIMGIIENNIEELEVPHGTSEISSSLFYENTKLKKVILPETIKTINWSAFEYCSNLSVIEFRGTVEQWETVYKGNYWISGTKVTEIVCSNGTASV